MDDRNAVKVQRIKKRQDFLLAKNGGRAYGRAFVLQAYTRRDKKPASIPDNAARFGVTVTKKIGNAVVRNRIRRRLNEVIRLSAAEVAQKGADYVLVAHKSALSIAFPDLIAEVLNGIDRLRGKKTYKKGRSYPISTKSKQSYNERQLSSGRRRNVSGRSHSTGTKLHE